jgi:hypothetical protein
MAFRRCLIPLFTTSYVFSRLQKFTLYARQDEGSHGVLNSCQKLVAAPYMHWLGVWSRFRKSSLSASVLHPVRLVFVASSDGSCLVEVEVLFNSH